MSFASCAFRVRFLVSFLILLFVAFAPGAAIAQTATCPLVNSCLELLDRDADGQCPLFPLLPDALSPPPGPSGYNLTAVRPGLFVYNDNQYHSVIIYTPATGRLLVVDFPTSFTSFRIDPATNTTAYLLLSAVRDVVGAFPSPRLHHVHMVYSHRHLDHIGAARQFYDFIATEHPSAHISVYGTIDTKRYLRRRPIDRRLPMPTRLVWRGQKNIVYIQLSTALVVRLVFIGGHTGFDLFVHVPSSSHNNGNNKQKSWPTRKSFAYFADLVEPRYAPLGFPLDVYAYQTALRHVLRYDFDVLSAAHSVLGSKKDVMETLQLSNDVLKAARNAAVTTDIRPVLACGSNPADPAYRHTTWTIFSIGELQARTCAKDVIRQWGCRLSGVALVAEALCTTMLRFVANEE